VGGTETVSVQTGPEIPEARPHVPPFAVVGIGASAGGLEAFGELLTHLPPDTGLAFVLVQHLDPSHPSMLTTILSRRSPIPVHEATDGVKYEANQAYVIPPNTLLEIVDGSLRLSPRPDASAAHMPIDYFLCSLAEQLGSSAIGVVLSGTGADGAAGLMEIKAKGGLTFAQDEETATYPGMPRAAVQSGAVDFVLAPARVAEELARIARIPDALRESTPSGLVDGAPELRRLLGSMKQATGADLSYFKPATLLRRLARRMLLLNVDSLESYVEHTQARPEELTALHNDILINVTGFFRDPEMLEGLSRHVFPALLKDRPAGDAIRIWVPGCSTGQEAYSIAIALLEYSATVSLDFPIQIFATDLSERAVAKCRAGLYGHEIELSQERLSRFFVKTEHGYLATKAVRDLCIFAKHNLLEDPPYSQLDLVSCRNVLIYLRPEYQRRLFEIFHYALKPTGFLMLGRSEAASSATDLFDAVDKPTRIYAKKPATRSPIHFTPRPEAFPARREVVTDPTRKLSDLVRRADSVLAHHTPTAVVIDEAAEILHLRGDPKPYLSPPPGPVTTNLLRMARDPLQLDLRAAIDAARKTDSAVHRGPVVLSDDGRERRVTLEVTPIMLRDGESRHFVVLFSEDPAGEARPDHSSEPLPQGEAAENAETAELRARLRETRQQLEESIQEVEDLNEEFRSAHEEALSGNEELQSTNEELETAKEELQSANEELTTVNDELQARSVELSQTNNDLTNVLSSVSMPVILVGPDLCLRRFTPMATKVLNVIASDIGRPITDITLNVALPDLRSVVLETIETMQPHEREVQDEAGHWYVMRVRPYHTHEGKIDGAVLMLLDVDELRRALARARESRDYAEAVVATVREPLVVLDEELRVVTANHGFYETFQVAPEQTENRIIFEVGDRQWDVPRLRELLEEVIPRHATFENFEMVKDVPGIGPRTVLLNARRIERVDQPSRLLLAIEDVTERREAESERENKLTIAERARAEAEGAGDLLRRVQTIIDTALLKLSFEDLLHEVAERVRATLEGDTTVILLRKMQGDVNEEDLALYARAASGLEEEVREAIRVPMGRGFAGRVAAERRPLIFNDVDYARAEGSYIREKRLRSIIGVPLLTESGLLGVIQVGSVHPRRFARRDVEILMLAAERIAHAVEVAARRQSEERARAIAEAANRAKDEFLALLSHELRNPLAAVRNAVLSARLDPSRRERALEIAGRQSDHLTRLVDDLLDVARVTQGKIRLRLERISPSQAISQAVESARAYIDARGHTLSVTCSGTRVVDVDPVRLEQIIENLLTNAAKYTPPGGHIEVRCEDSGAEMELRVRDNGIGIAAEVLPWVFDLFAQGDKGLDRSQGGLGIGLTVVRRLVELHGGRIEARSEGPGRGSEFIVWLPALPGGEEQSLACPAAPVPASSARILVIEDNPDAAESLMMLLELFGNRVRVVHDGPAALAAVEKESPDIAFVDIGLPGMDGYELVRLLRQHPRMERTTLVALSGYGRDEDKQRALAAGFHVHLTKPVDGARLKALLAELGAASTEPRAS
jgi:two-component system CheB/CheR fusion protein